MNFLNDIFEIAEKGHLNLNLQVRFKNKELQSAFFESRLVDAPIWNEVIKAFKAGHIFNDFGNATLTIAKDGQKKTIERKTTEEKIVVKESRKRSRERVFRIELSNPRGQSQEQFIEELRYKKYSYMWEKDGSFVYVFKGKRPPIILINIVDEGKSAFLEIPIAFSLPQDNTDPEPDLNKRGDPRIKYYRASRFVKVFKNEKVEFQCGGRKHYFEVVGLIAGERVRNSLNPLRIPHKKFFGLYLLKDYIPVEHRPDLIGPWEKYIHFLIFVNCNDLELDGNGRPVKNQLYYALEEALRSYLHSDSDVDGSGAMGLLKRDFVRKYFALRKQDLSHFATSRAALNLERKLKAFPGFWSLEEYKFLRGEPRNETETLLLFQAMISLGFDEIDFIIKNPVENNGSYLAYDPSDSKPKLVKVRHKLSDFLREKRNFDGAYALVCWTIDLDENTEFALNNYRVRYVREKDGHYLVCVDDETKRWKVYVLSEILKSKPLQLI